MNKLPSRPQNLNNCVVFDLTKLLKFGLILDHMNILIWLIEFIGQNDPSWWITCKWLFQMQLTFYTPKNLPNAPHFPTSAIPPQLIFSNMHLLSYLFESPVLLQLQKTKRRRKQHFFYACFKRI